MNYTQFHHHLIQALQTHIVQQPPFTDDTLDELHEMFLTKLEQVVQDPYVEEDGMLLGSWVITTIINRYPHITPSVPRDLLWFFGSDCMHFLGDEEVEQFQKLQDQLYEAGDPDTVNYETLRNNALKLH